MNESWILYLTAFVGAFIISLVTTPLAKTLSIKLGAIDYPKKRGMHNKPMPRMGGIAIVLGFMIMVIILSFFIEGLDKKQFIGLIVGSMIIVILGMIDDVKNLRSRTKFCVQIIAALVVIFSGTKIELVLWPFTAFFQKFSIPITLLWIVGVTNAVNLIDGLDGLASGVSSIAALSLMVLCIMTGSELSCVLTAAIAGSCLGFLPRNFNPAELFMGDTGATFLGFTLAVSSIMGVFKGYAVLAVTVSTLCLGLPVFDTLFAMGRRAINGKPIMQADRGHLHHRLIDKGFSQRQTVLILYAISISCGLLAIAISLHNFKTIFVVIIMMLLMMYSIAKSRKNKKNH